MGMTYKDYIRHQQAKVNELPIFFAFSTQQLEEALKERGLTLADTDQLYRLGHSGGFYLKKDAPVIRAYFQGPDMLGEYMKDEAWAEDAFLYEMDNHEYAINWQADFDVCSCFTSTGLEYGEDKTYIDYLKEAGLEHTIKAYQRAKARHMKHAQEWF